MYEGSFRVDEDCGLLVDTTVESLHVRLGRVGRYEV